MEHISAKQYQWNVQKCLNNHNKQSTDKSNVWNLTKNKIKVKSYLNI